MDLAAFFAEYSWVIALALIWTISWKGVALWKAARNESLGWFVVMLIINTLGILEIVYIFFFSGKKEAPKPAEIPTVSAPEEKIPEPKIQNAEPETVEEKAPPVDEKPAES
jgi:methionyl-tRNA synthetase